jgi:hypothetical protein
MPHRRYHPRVPPTAMDHWLAHPYELSTAVAGLAAARSEPRGRHRRFPPVRTGGCPAVMRQDI